jgi:RNA polymerase-binding transcription factor
MSEQDWTARKEQLLAQREELTKLEQIGDEAARPVELDQSGMGRLSRMDAMQVQAMAKDAKARRELNVQKTDNALKRIEKGTYGLCVRCKREISIQRLDFDPAIVTCIKCAK